MRNTKSIGMILMLGLPLACLAARNNNMELAWSELESRIQGQTVALLLPDGTRIEGAVQSVESDALVMDVRKSSNRALHPKGRTSIPRRSAGTLELRTRRIKWQVLGPAIGAAPGIIVCAAVVKYANNEGGMNGTLSAICAVPLGLGLSAGYFGGRAEDRQVTYIKVKDVSAL